MQLNLWNTFDDVREKLSRQYRPMQLAEDTGLTVPELEAGMRAYLAAHADEPRIRTKAAILAYLLRNGQIGVDDYDWFADHIGTGRLLWKLQGEWYREAGKGIPPRTGVGHPAGTSQLDLSHTSPDWRNVLKYGPAGLRDRARAALESAQDSEAREFYAAVATVYDAFCDYILRLAAEAERRNAVRVIDVLKALAVRPAQTFHEALQISFLYNQVQEIDGVNVRSQGHFDQECIEYYRRDLAEGRLTRDQAKELIKFFFERFEAVGFKAGNNICFGGWKQDGTDACNELTELAFEAFAERDAIDPKLSLRLNPGTSDTYLLAAAECVRNGQTAIVFANDEVAYDMFRRAGKAEEDLIDWLPIGCYEPAIMGKELSCTMSAMLNLPRVLEYVFAEPDAPADFAEVVDRYKRILAGVIDETLAQARAWEECWPRVNPSPVISGTLDCCVESGRDVSNAGTTYSTSGVMCAGIGTVADSLAAINYLVFEHGICSWKQLRDCLEHDWESAEDLRAIALRKAPKWGNDVSVVDDLAVDVARYTAQKINQTPNQRGGHFQMGCWSIDHSVNFGKQTKATPDGRRNGDPISKNAGATISRDRCGITSLINSVAKLDHADFPDGSVLDLMLHPTAVNSPDGARVIADLVRTYFARGGLFVHFNVFDAKALKDARRHPERYTNLQVRVCGWNARFIDLTPEMQECFIAEAEKLEPA
jgi:formate C-acetyltransferase